MSNRKDETNFIKYFVILSIFMLFGAIAEWPYGYYILLRWITCITSISKYLDTFRCCNCNPFYICNKNIINRSCEA
jgi:predicted permease